MARYTASEKWGDGWFSDLNPIEKLIFLYLTDKCDNAGFFEINKRLDPLIIGITLEQYLDGLSVISRCYIKSTDGRKIWLKNYLKHQKNLPLKPENNAHKQIIQFIVTNQYLFEYDFNYLGAYEGLFRCPVMYSNGNVFIKEVLQEKENLSQKHFEDMVVQKMMQTWMKHNPNYQGVNEVDFPALLQLGYKIAKSKKWHNHEILNGKMDECLLSWETVVKFIRASDFYKKLELTTIDKRWAGLFQSMEAAKEGSSNPKEIDPTKVKISIR